MAYMWVYATRSRYDWWNSGIFADLVACACPVSHSVLNSHLNTTHRTQPLCVIVFTQNSRARSNTNRWEKLHCSLLCACGMCVCVCDVFPYLLVSYYYVCGCTIGISCVCMSERMKSHCACDDVGARWYCFGIFWCGDDGKTPAETDNRIIECECRSISALTLRLYNPVLIPRGLVFW